jgi:hypothetical protein
MLTAGLAAQAPGAKNPGKLWIVLLKERLKSECAPHFAGI